MKYLAIDIETEPHLAYVWDVWKPQISRSNIVRQGGIMCFAAQERDLSKPEGKQLKKTKFYATWTVGRGTMVQRLWDLLDAAQAVVTYNGTRFDLKRINYAFLEQGLPAPTPYANIDLYATVRRSFQAPYKSLGDIAKVVNAESLKGDSGGMATWIGCLNGDKEARAKMREYNIADIAPMHDIYDKLLSWDTRTPGIQTLDRTPNWGECPRCGKNTLTSNGYRTTTTRTYRRYRCTSCGSNSSEVNQHLNDLTLTPRG